jgi:hypothetical protein
MNESLSGHPAPPSPAPGLRTWLREGLRAAVLRTPRTQGSTPRPRELLLLVLIATGIELALARLEVPGTADFSLRGWLAPSWSVAALVLLLWALGAGEPRPHAGGMAAWFALWLVATIPPGLVSQVLGIAQGWELLPETLAESALFALLVYLGLMAWVLAIALHLASHFGLAQGRLRAFGAALVLIFAVSGWLFPDRPWEAPPEPEAESAGMVLSDESFEAQQALFRQSVDRLAPQRPGVTDVYGIVFAPYATEDVFLRESTMVANLLAQRFDAQGRVLQLVNHPDTVESLPWATPRNLKRAIEAVAARMDREHDLLVLYLTSHGASDFRLAAALPPLRVEPVSPGELRTALDEAGIRFRVIAISACYAGGWVGPLGSDTTLVMTAADADHTSYGCGARSELTFFGRAVFDEQLQRTHSFEQAFAAAVPVIRRREEEARKTDGFSNPQISVGEGIRPLLKALEKRLETP